MAPPSRRNTASLKEELFERATAFDFFQAVRLLHKLRPEDLALPSTMGLEPGSITVTPQGLTVGFVPKQ